MRGSSCKPNNLGSPSREPAYRLRLHCDCITLASVFRAVRDSDWSADHLAAHGVTLEEVREVVLERPYWRTHGRADTILFYGQTHAGRCLFVVAIAQDDEEAFIVAARDMTDAEQKTFRRKAR